MAPTDNLNIYLNTNLNTDPPVRQAVLNHDAFGKLKNKKLVLFFTYGVSLDLWERRGLLARELKLYQKLGEYFEKIYFITYGRMDGRFAAKLAADNIAVLPKKFRCPNFIYSLILPIIYWKELSGADFYKTNQMLGSWTAVIAKWLYKKKLIVRTGYSLSLFSQKTSSIKFYLSKVIEKLAGYFSGIIVVASESEKTLFCKHVNKVRVIPNYVDTDLFTPGENSTDSNEINLLFVGRLEPQKNLENLLLALVGLKNIKLTIIGFGSLEDKLKLIVKKNILKVEFLGNVPHSDLPKFFNRSQIFVLPSLYEGNPKVLLEAMACGIPVLATKVDGISATVTHLRDAFLTEIDSVSLRGGIEILLNDLALRERIGHGARQTILNCYSLDKIINLELKNY